MKLSPLQKKVKGGLKIYMLFTFAALLVSVYQAYLGQTAYLIFVAAQAVLLLLAFGVFKDYRFTRFHKWLRAFHMLWLLFWINAAAVIYALYLSYVTVFVQDAINVLCLVNAGLVIAMLFALLNILSEIDAQKKKNPDVCEFC